MPTDIPEQRPMYMESIGETKSKFMGEIEEVMKRVALDAYDDETFIENYINDLEESRTFFYRSMKGTIPITPEDVEELLREEVKRQEAFYGSLKELVIRMPDGKILPPNQIVEYPHWEHSPSFGCNISSGSTVLYAYPRLPASTKHFLTLKQGPVSAHVIHVEDEYVLMLPYGQDLSEELRSLFINLSGITGKVNIDGIKVRIRKNYLSMITEEKVYQKTLDKILKDYGGLAIQVGHQSDNTAYIHTGLGEDLPRLWSIIYFEWRGNWRRHQ